MLKRVLRKYRSIVQKNQNSNLRGTKKDNRRYSKTCLVTTSSYLKMQNFHLSTKVSEDQNCSIVDYRFAGFTQKPVKTMFETSVHHNILNFKIYCSRNLVVPTFFWQILCLLNTSYFKDRHTILRPHLVNNFHGTFFLNEILKIYDPKVLRPLEMQRITLKDEKCIHLNKRPKSEFQ